MKSTILLTSAISNPFSWQIDTASRYDTAWLTELEYSTYFEIADNLLNIPAPSQETPTSHDSWAIIRVSYINDVD